MCANILTFTATGAKTSGKAIPTFKLEVIAIDTPDLQHHLPLGLTPAV